MGEIDGRRYLQCRSARQEIHVDFPERMDVFAEKIRLFPEGCWKRVRKDQIVGYGIAHPWQLFSIPPLDQFLNNLPARGRLSLHS